MNKPSLRHACGWLFLTLLIPLTGFGQESVFLHLDKTTYVSGETIWFKAYCIDQQTALPSTLSRVLYVELLNESAQPVFQERIALSEGLGHGQLFIDGEVPTGMYYLKAYTAWMRNFDEELFFEQAVRIVHPFRAADPTLRPLPTQTKPSPPPASDAYLTAESAIVSPRDSLHFTLQLPEAFQQASLSVSVHRFAPELESPALPITEYGRFQEKADPPTSYAHLPEKISPLLQGKIQVPSEQTIFVLFPGPEPAIYELKPNVQREFVIELSPDINRDSVYFWSPGKKVLASQVQLDSPFEAQHEIVQAQAWTVDSSWLNYLAQLSLGSQVSNAYLPYSEVRGRLTPTDTNRTPFYGRADTEYMLDEYTRFPSMDEVFLEYVRYVVRRRRNKQDVLLVNDLYRNEASIASALVFPDPALLMIDGVPLEEVQTLWDFDPLLVERIHLVQRKYYAGNYTFPGIVHLQTYRRNFGGQPYPTYLLSRPYAPLQQAAQFVLPTQQKRVPDFRNLLWWEPMLQVGRERSISLKVPTGDQTGTFRIEVNGMASDGTLFHTQTMITVQ